MSGLRDTRFKKGQSGNPNGRPKGARSKWSPTFAESVLKAGDREITVTENGRLVAMTMHEATLRAQQSAALKGSTLAQRHLIDTYLAADTERRQRIAEECEAWEEIRNKLIELRAEAERAGRPPAMPFPHPDDIVIDPERGVRFIGPIDAAEQAMVEDTIQMRDLLLAQDHYDHRECGPINDSDPSTGAGASLLFAQVLNNWLPERYRLATLDMINMTMPLDRLTKRELRKMLFQRWKAQGRAIPRGKTFGSLAKGEEVLGILFESLGASLNESRV